MAKETVKKPVTKAAPKRRKKVVVATDSVSAGASFAHDWFFSTRHASSLANSSGSSLVATR